MNDIKLFSNEVFGNVRATLIDNKVWFVGKDVAEALGYKDTKDAINTHCKKDGVAIYHLIDSLGRTQQAKYINQRNVIRLIMRSKLPQAEEFQDWVEEEIIPSVLETGSYSITKKDSYMIDDPIERAKRWIEETEEHQRQLEEKQAIINKQKPLVEYAEAMNNSTNEDMTIAQFARYTKLGKKELFQFFRDNKVLFYDNGVNVPYQKYIDKGYFKVITKVSQHQDGRYYNYEQTLITSKGRERVLKFYPQLKR